MQGMWGKNIPWWAKTRMYCRYLYWEAISWWIRQMWTVWRLLLLWWHSKDLCIRYLRSCYSDYWLARKVWGMFRVSLHPRQLMCVGWLRPKINSSDWWLMLELWRLLSVWRSQKGVYNLNLHRWTFLGSRRSMPWVSRLHKCWRYREIMPWTILQCFYKHNSKVRWVHVTDRRPRP